MRRIVVSSPGPAIALHWSHAQAAAIAGALAAAGDDVLWYAVVRPGQVTPPSPPGCELRASIYHPLPPLHQVAHDHGDLAFEQVLQGSLREQAAAAIVHVGAGARGSPNLLWLAERMGSAAFAVVRAAEVVCHRGDLVDRTGAACDHFLDAGRCRDCCAGSWWRRPPRTAFADRGDLVAGSLLAARAVFVADPAELPPLVEFGLLPRSLCVANTAAIAERVRGERSAS